MVEVSKSLTKAPLTSSTAETRAFAPREEVHNALLDAVGRLLQRYGYRKTSVGDIAEEAGVSRATAYLYFASKEAMVLSWVERREADRLNRLRTISREGGENVRLRDRIAALLLARVLLKFDDARPYMNSLQGLQGIDDLRAALRAPLLELREKQQESECELVAEILREASTKGELPDRIDPRTAARLLILGTNSLLPINLTLAQQDKRDEVETLAQGLIGLLLDGLWCR
jgi:AcrR family transcriptional regulator